MKFIGSTVNLVECIFVYKKGMVDISKQFLDIILDLDKITSLRRLTTD